MQFHESLEQQKKELEADKKFFEQQQEILLKEKQDFDSKLENFSLEKAQYDQNLTELKSKNFGKSAKKLCRSISAVPH